MPRKPPLKIVHIRRQVLANNIRNNLHDPVVIARRKNGPGVIRSNKIHVLDANGNIAATVICDIDHPLKCGARCYIQTNNTIVNAENETEKL